MMSTRGTIIKNPEVGLGVVGKKTLTCSLPNFVATSSAGVPVTNAIVQDPFLGYGISTAFLNALPLLENNVPDTCFTLE